MSVKCLQIRSRTNNESDMRLIRASIWGGNPYSVIAITFSILVRYLRNLAGNTADKERASPVSYNSNNNANMINSVC